MLLLAAKLGSLITDIRGHLQITLLSSTPHFQVFMLSIEKNKAVCVCVCVCVCMCVCVLVGLAVGEVHTKPGQCLTLNPSHRVSPFGVP
jgi:hypothetical protein